MHKSEIDFRPMEPIIIFGLDYRHGLLLCCLFSRHMCTLSCTVRKWGYVTVAVTVNQDLCDL